MQKAAPASLAALLDRDVAAVREWERERFADLAGDAADRVVLFGAGNLGRKVVAGLLAAGRPPLAVADNNPALWGTTIGGVPVLSPEEAARRHGADAVFVVTIWSAGSRSRFADTATQLADLGCARVLPLAPLAWRYPHELLPHFALDLPHKVVAEREAVLAAADLWADERSRREYLAQVRWRLEGDFAALPPRSPELEYFPEDLIAMGAAEHFVDCGAYDGDTVKRFLSLCNGFERITAFEPDPRNFERLGAYVAELPPDTGGRIACIQAAVSDRRTRLDFFADGSAGASLAALTAQARPTVAVEAVLLDEALAEGPPPTYLKLDVEGAEAEALTGAAGLIRRHLPRLAVCVYHRQADLWRLPLQVRDLSDRYRFFLRAHSEGGFDVVCYAVAG
ncbi:MAG: FkbM family methyltransferase [Candidatus Sericytochromatia bacterium]|nr:FkbM family methyltransferase [Candidatus Tanganyikabacteria bacterium]